MLKSKLWRIVRKVFLTPRAFVVWALLLTGLWFFYREAQSILAEPITSWESEFDSDCAVVLTGGAVRVREGFDLLARKKVKKLIISGVHPDVQVHELMPLWPFYGNLNEQDIILEKHSQTTYGNAQQSLYIVESLKCRDIILVTGHLHMYRAYNTFRSIYPEEIAIFKDTIVANSLKPTLQDLSQEALKSLFYAAWAH